MTPNPLLYRIGLVIRRSREALKLSQEEFANEHQINRTHYGAIERGTQNLTILNLSRVAGGLNKSLSQLLREAEKLDLEKASLKPHNPPRRGRPPGRKSRWQ
ncbi:MAG: helix-turn-helix domain-containing protein [Rudaea sp.]